MSFVERKIPELKSQSEMDLSGKAIPGQQGFKAFVSPYKAAITPCKIRKAFVLLRFRVSCISFLNYKYS